MSHVLLGYDKDGHKVWSENTPSRARIPWTQAGSVSGVMALPSRVGPQPVDRSAAASKGWVTKRLRGEGLKP